ncbi:hypothetical protein KJ877_00265 [bacterium]|nr:hypothetical protein [bacterium]MBU1990302.1 hypothetical protein [bacterium]
MRLSLLFIFAISVYGLETCYSVQLLSRDTSGQNFESLSKSEYPKGCKLMEIEKSLTVRCGCFESFIASKQELSKLQSAYTKAAVVTTYKYRFEELLKKEESGQKEELPLKTQVEQTIQTVELQELPPAVQNVALQKFEEIEYPVQSIALAPKIGAADVEQVAKKKKKKKKKKKVKYIKKRDGDYFYDKYLQKLKSQKGSRDLDYKYKFGAQFSYDAAYIYEADHSYWDRDWRRIRVYHKGSFFDEDLFYEAEYSFTGDNKYKDIFIGYKDLIEPLDLSYRIKYGNIKIPFSLESYSSSKYITFMERALTDSFATGRKMGGEIVFSKEFEESRLNIFASAFSNSIDEQMNEEANRPGYSMRWTYAYKFAKNHLFSVGSALMYQDMKNTEIKFNQASESEFIREKYVSVKIQDVDIVRKKNIEVLYINNKYSLQSEYVKTYVDALKDSYAFQAYYLQGSYFIIGSSRKYKLSSSTLAQIKPNKDGALELALRYSHIDLNDKDERGGAQTDYNYGINWYINDELKLMFNYVVAEPKGTDEYDGRLQIVEARALFAF